MDVLPLMPGSEYEILVEETSRTIAPGRIVIVGWILRLRDVS